MARTALQASQDRRDHPGRPDSKAQLEATVRRDRKDRRASPARTLTTAHAHRAMEDAVPAVAAAVAWAAAAMVVHLIDTALWSNCDRV